MSKWWHTANLQDPRDSAFYGRIPKAACAYAIYLNGALSYIGSTENLRSRCRQHGIDQSPPRYSNVIPTPWGSFLNVVIKYRKYRQYGDWLAIEARLIRRLRPRFNIRFVSREERQISVASLG